MAQFGASRQQRVYDRSSIEKSPMLIGMPCDGGRIVSFLKPKLFGTLRVMPSLRAECII
jgi:hypothetical protein